MASKCSVCKVELVSAAAAGKMKCPKCGKVFVLKSTPKPGEKTSPTPPVMPRVEKPKEAESVSAAPKPATRAPRPAAATGAPVTPVTPEGVAADIKAFDNDFKRVMAEVGKMIVGMQDVVEKVAIAMIAGGNVLLEGVPGLGKTQLVKVLSQALQIDFRRVQFTPDLMPADIVGTNMVTEDSSGRRTLQFQRGPIFTHLLLADEINRATPRTQSALLEAMEEHSVTVGGTTFKLEEPFFVLATQNPVEQAGTYPLPAAQLDKFMFKMVVPYPTFDELDEVIERTTTSAPPEIERVTSRDEILRMRQLVRRVPVAAHVESYAARIVLATDPTSKYATDMVRKYVRHGSSPRGVLALILGGKIRALLDGRFSLSCADIQNIAPGALRHRLAVNFDGESDGVDRRGPAEECARVRGRSPLRLILKAFLRPPDRMETNHEQAQQDADRRIPAHVQRATTRDGQSHRRLQRHHPRHAGVLFHRRQSADREQPGPGQNAAREDAGARDRSQVLAHPVYARPDAGRYPWNEHRDRRRRWKTLLRIPEGTGLHAVAARRRNQSRHAQDAVGVARGHAGTARNGRRQDIRPRKTVLCRRHPESTGYGRHLFDA
jgi:MoxR-like ATPase